MQSVGLDERQNAEGNCCVAKRTSWVALSLSLACFVMVAVLMANASFRSDSIRVRELLILDESGETVGRIGGRSGVCSLVLGEETNLLVIESGTPKEGPSIEMMHGDRTTRLKAGDLYMLRQYEDPGMGAISVQLETGLNEAGLTMVRIEGGGAARILSFNAKRLNQSDGWVELIASEDGVRRSLIAK